MVPHFGLLPNVTEVSDIYFLGTDRSKLIKILDLYNKMQYGSYGGRAMGKLLFMADCPS